MSRTKVDIIIEGFRKWRKNNSLLEDTLPFLLYRTDTNPVLANGIYGYEAAKDKANDLRKLLGLKWEQVKCRADKTKKVQKANPQGPEQRIEYSNLYNLLKRGRFRRHRDAQWKFHDLDWERPANCCCLLETTQYRICYRKEWLESQKRGESINWQSNNYECLKPIQNVFSKKKAEIVPGDCLITYTGIFRFYNLQIHQQ